MDKKIEQEVKKFLAAGIAKGVSLSELQQEINQEFKLKLTYMDIRIFASELESVDWDKNDPKAQAKAKEEAAAEAVEAGGEEELVEPELEEAPAGSSNTVVEVSKLVRPGMALSGTVTFASGSTAEWYVDNYGRLGLENLQGEKPTETDVREFQQELQRIFSR